MPQWRHLSWQLWDLQMHLSSWLHRDQLSGREKYSYLCLMTCLGFFTTSKYLLSFLCQIRILCAGVTLFPAKMEAHVGSKVPPTPASVRLDGLASTVTSQVFPVRWQLNSKVRSFRLWGEAFDSKFAIVWWAVCTFWNSSFVFDCRCWRGSLMPEFRPVSGCWKHALLPLPSWLHWQLLPGTGGWVFTQPLPKWSHLHWLSRRLQLWGKRIYE